MQAISEGDSAAARTRLLAEIERGVDEIFGDGVSFNTMRFLSGCERILHKGCNNVLTDFLQQATKGGEQYLLQAERELEQKYQNNEKLSGKK